jgi:hypothetical protein
MVFWDVAWCKMELFPVGPDNASYPFLIPHLTGQLPWPDEAPPNPLPLPNNPDLRPQDGECMFLPNVSIKSTIQTTVTYSQHFVFIYLQSLIINLPRRCEVISKHLHYKITVIVNIKGNSKGMIQFHKFIKI